MSFRGYVQVYTGNGKGKTTAAMGLALRALGAGKKVLFMQFMKARGYSEHKMLEELSPNLTLKTLGKPFFVIEEGAMPEEELAKWRKQAVIFPPGQPPAEYVQLMKEGLDMAREALRGKEYQLVVLDELVVALHFGLVQWEDICSLIDQKSHDVELVLTGRGAPPELIEKADLVTEMREIKHYFTQGVQARRGIEN
ncbi:MAG: cob(I)yrinic acid a,c-diamide adenosyltransferase [Bacillota bacterium]|jgi:cob(I)alamin adenosyltransferase